MLLVVQPDPGAEDVVVGIFFTADTPADADRGFGAGRLGVGVRLGRQDVGHRTATDRAAIVLIMIFGASIDVHEQVFLHDMVFTAMEYRRIARGAEPGHKMIIRFCGVVKGGFHVRMVGRVGVDRAAGCTGLRSHAGGLRGGGVVGEQHVTAVARAGIVVLFSVLCGLAVAPIVVIRVEIRMAVHTELRLGAELLRIGDGVVCVFGAGVVGVVGAGAVMLLAVLGGLPITPIVVVPIAIVHLAERAHARRGAVRPAAVMRFVAFAGILAGAALEGKPMP